MMMVNMVFFIALNGDHPMGEMTYTWAGDDQFIIDHTAVDDIYRYQGVGQDLLDAIIAFARERNLKVLPLCPYAKSVFDKGKSFC